MLLAPLAIAVIGLTVAPTPVRADTLRMESAPASGTSAPEVRGRTKAQVRARLGAPTEELPAVGGDRPRHPPITRWVYPGFTVYFERDRALHAVVNRRAAAPATE
jgi:hypothetical protein